MEIPFFNSLRFKVGFGYIVLVAINVAVTTWAIYNFGRLAMALNGILGRHYPSVIAAENMARHIDRHDDALTSITAGDLNNGKITFTQAKDDFFQWFQRANENKTFPDAGLILDNINSTYKGYLILSDSLLQIAERGNLPEAKRFYESTLRPFSQRLTDNCFWLIEENQKEMANVARETKATSDEAIIAVLSASLVAFGLSVLTMVQFTKRIIEPAERLTETVHHIGRGRLDLKIDIQTNDEVGELSREFNKMTERLHRYETLNIEQILLEKQKSETIVESISDAIIVCDADGSVILINRSAEKLLNLSEENVLGKPIAVAIPDERILDIFEHPTESFRQDQPYLRFDHHGRDVYLRPRVSQIPAPHGGRGGVVLVLQDVTQFKELDKMKSDFMAAVSHEFRTPLTSINMAIDILRQGLLGPMTKVQKDLLNASKQDSERLTKLIRELLQLSRLESGKIEMRGEEVRFDAVVRSTVQLFDLPFKEKGVNLNVVISPELPTLMANEQQLSWIVSNLVSNALRYTDTGGRVDVDVRAEGNAILVSVSDTGRGIPDDQLGRIFDKFIQIKQSSDMTPGSVGLGLAIAKEIVEMYGGKIWVESEVNKGSVFSFRIPAHPVATV